MRLVRILTIVLLMLLHSIDSLAQGTVKVDEAQLPDGRLIELFNDLSWKEIPIVGYHTLDDGTEIEIFSNYTWRRIEKVAVINDQIWMNRNLNTEYFRDGTRIDQAKNLQEWNGKNTNQLPAWCYYNFDDSNEPIYGKLYNWWAIRDSRSLAPEGWHIPTSAEWTALNNFLNPGSSVKLSSVSGWSSEEQGTNSTGFNGLPGGYLQDSRFREMGDWAYFGSATPGPIGMMSFISFSPTSTELKPGYAVNTSGIYVRCIKD